MRGDSLRDFYAKSLALMGLALLGAVGAAVDYWPTAVAVPATPRVNRLAKSLNPLPPIADEILIAATRETPRPMRAIPAAATLAVNIVPATFDRTTSIVTTLERPSVPELPVATTEPQPAPDPAVAIMAAMDAIADTSPVPPERQFRITTHAPAPAPKSNFFVRTTSSIVSTSGKAGSLLVDAFGAAGSKVGGAVGTLGSSVKNMFGRMF